MRNVSIADAKAHLSELVDQAEAGDEVCITRRGKPVARLTAAKDTAKPIDVERLRKLTSTGCRQKESAGAFMRRLRDQLLIAYLDTSLLVAATTIESKTDAVLRWLGGSPSTTFAISDWTVTEYSAALSIKLREKAIDAGYRAKALSKFAWMCTDSLVILPVQASQFRDAARFADQFALGLRAGNALHLAVAAEHGAALYTLDKRQFAAGAKLGVRTELL